MENEWLLFEKAVAAYMNSLSKSAIVTHNIRDQDEQTGANRQRDVIIEDTICHVIPVKVLISCKKYKRKLTEMDIDHFYGELLNSNANKGVLYSYSGFNRLAVSKAKKLKISCFTLIDENKKNSPVPINFDNFYICYPHFYIRLVEKKDINDKYKQWKDIFHEKMENISNFTFLDSICRTIEKHQSEISASLNSNTFPKAWKELCEIYDDNDTETKLSIIFGEFWLVFHYVGEAKFISGVFSFTDNCLLGSFKLPAKNIHKINPGSDWEAIFEIPKNEKNIEVRTIFLRDIRPEILRSIGDYPIEDNRGI